MDTRLLRAFVAVFEERNITQAALRCHVSQPALSASIRQLEEELGAELFTRKAKGVDVTEAARQLYPRALRLVEELGSLPQLFTRQEVEPFTLGIMPDIGHGLLAGFLRICNELAPATPLHLVDWEQPCHARLALDVLRREDELFLPVCDEEYVFCLRHDHPLATRDTVTPADLDGEDFIVCPPCEAHQRTLGLCAGGRGAPRVAARADYKRQVAALALAGMGVTFLPVSLVEEVPALVVRPFAGPQFHRRVGVCYTSQAAALGLIQALATRLQRGLLTPPWGV